MKITYSYRNRSGDDIVDIFTVPTVALFTVLILGVIFGSGFSTLSILCAAISLVITANYVNTVFEFKKFEFAGGLKLSFEEEKLSSQVNDVQASQKEGYILDRS
ncbi:MAG: hypothetical protein PV340_01680 [Wolbachia sp.]|nr:hypothetical protein [Wolbachia sp.]MDD9336677.1 hypothetical protein [Wolbachia sp.]